MSHPASSETSTEHPASDYPVRVPRGHHLIIYRGRKRPGGASIDGRDDLADALHTYGLWFGAVRPLRPDDYTGSPPGFVVARLPEPSDRGYEIICRTLREHFDIYVPVMPGKPRPPFADDVEG